MTRETGSLTGHGRSVKLPHWPNSGRRRVDIKAGSHLNISSPKGYGAAQPLGKGGIMTSGSVGTEMRHEGSGWAGCEPGQE